MKKILISLACAVICCACDARRNNAMTDGQKNIQTETTSDTNDVQEGVADGQMAGKYVLIDFWGTWCIWCVRGMPMMKEYYKKYSDKMEILGVDCNDPEKKWKAVVKELDLPWKHVYNPKGSSEILQKYQIQGFPTKILVDPEGKIAKTVIGEDPAFYQYLDETLK